MKSFMHLVSNEHMKIFKRQKIWVLFGLIAVMNIVVSLFFKYLFTGIVFTFWDYIQVSSYLLVAVQLMCIMIAGEIVSSEFEKGTIKLLFIRPVKRVKVLASKYTMVLYISLLLVAFQLFMSVILGLIFYAGTFLTIDQTVLFGLGGYLFSFIEILVMGTIAFCLSAVTRSSVFSIAVPIFLLFTSRAVVSILEHNHYAAGKYLLFSNTNLSPYFFGQPLFDGMTLTFSIINILVHMGLLGLIAVLFFTKRDVHV